MKDRFTRKSRVGRGRIPRQMRTEIYERDNFTCQFCDRKLPQSELTIDHVIPVALGGLDEPINYVSCCRDCNQSKADLSLEEFSIRINIKIEDLPIHGDPVIENEELPIQLRLIRKRIIDRIRRGAISASTTSAQKKIERAYRRAFWETAEGKELEEKFPNLPGHVRIMIPEIRIIAKNSREYLLLVELAKSANTRNLIGGILTPDCDVEKRIQSIVVNSQDESLKRRIRQAVKRFEKELRRQKALVSNI